jgi:hypothetical protein
MMFRTVAVVSVLVLLSAPGERVQADDPAPDVSMEGLKLVEKDRRGEIYADPDTDWSVYSRIQLDEATVAFRKNWQRDQNRSQPFKVRTEDMERIKSELSALFGEVFAEELKQNGGYELSVESAEDVMRITPRIVDLDVYAPDTRSSPGRTMSYTEQAGRMTLQLDIFDSVTGDMIAKTSDRQEAPRRGYMQWTTSVTNRAEARRMIERWAREFRERLDQARASGTAGE